MVSQAPPNFGLPATWRAVFFCPFGDIVGHKYIGLFDILFLL